MMLLSYGRCKYCPSYNAKREECSCQSTYTKCLDKLYAEIVEEKKPSKNVDWSKVAVDTPILVWYSGENSKIKRYFAKYENGRVYAWNNGCTSWTTSKVSAWEYAELAEVKYNGTY